MYVTSQNIIKTLESYVWNVKTLPVHVYVHVM